MYLPNLISLVRHNQNISDNTISAIDDFLGQISENGVFKESDLLSVLPQKKLLPHIISFLLTNKIIEAYTIKCPICGREDKVDSIQCDNCCSPINATENFYRYRIIFPINISDAEKKQRDDSRQRLLLSSFRILTAKINNKMKRGENGSILLFDIANSTELSKANVFLMNHIKKEFNNLIRDLGFSYLRNHNGHYIKSDGDSAFVYLNDVEIVKQFIVDFNENFTLHPCYSSIKEINAEKHGFDCFLKIYHSSSQINNFFKPDILSLDFTGMDAFVLNNRIEKKVKEIVLSNYDLSDVIPYYFCSTCNLNLPNSKRFIVEDVQNIGNVEVFLNVMSDISEYVEDKQSPD